MVVRVYTLIRSFRRRRWHPTPVLLPGKSYGQRSLVGCSPWGRKESDMTEWLPFHFSLSGYGEGNGNPLQCSCLENPRDRGAWWAAVYGVAQSSTRLKRLSSSSSLFWECFLSLPYLPLLSTISLNLCLIWNVKVILCGRVIFSFPLFESYHTSICLSAFIFTRLSYYYHWCYINQ